jgi:hypothetical protein
MQSNHNLDAKEIQIFLFFFLTAVLNSGNTRLWISLMGKQSSPPACILNMTEREALGKFLKALLGKIPPFLSSVGVSGSGNRRAEIERIRKYVCHS